MKNLENTLKDEKQFSKEKKKKFQKFRKVQTIAEPREIKSK